MAIPVLPFLGVIAAGYAVWRGLGGRKRNEASALNNWQNEDFASREADGTWTEGSTQVTPVTSRPPDYLGING